MSRRNLLRPFAGLQGVNLEGVQLRLIDAKDQVVGRLCAQLALILQGKDKPCYDPSKDYGDICVVINAAKVEFTGKKWETKKYKWYTVEDLRKWAMPHLFKSQIKNAGYPGGLRDITAKQLWKKDPAEILYKAVKGMLPRNTIREDRLRKLRIYSDEQHPFQEFELKSFEMPHRALRDKSLGWVIPRLFEPMNPTGYDLRMRTSKMAKEMKQPEIGFDDLLSSEERNMASASLRTSKQ